MIEQLNVYEPAAWLAEFETTDEYRAAMCMYDHVIASHQEMTLLKAALHHTVYDKARNVCEEHGILDAVPHYYIRYLLQKRPTAIVDIGCGQNVFKKVYPGITGIDSDRGSAADVFDHFDEDFVLQHPEFYDAVITINAIHFHPIHSITKRLLMINQLLRPGGRAFVSTNLETWLMHTSKSDVLAIFGGLPKFNTVMEYVHQQIMASNLEFLVIDYPVLAYARESTIRDDHNGNLRLVFEK